MLQGSVGKFLDFTFLWEVFFFAIYIEVVGIVDECSSCMSRSDFVPNQYSPVN